MAPLADFGLISGSERPLSFVTSASSRPVTLGVLDS